MAVCTNCTPEQTIAQFTVQCRVCEEYFKTTNPNMADHVVNCESCADKIGCCQICEADLDC